MARARGIWFNLKSSLWFLPAICLVIAVALAFGLAEVDARLGASLADRWPRIFGLSADGARSILAAVAQSMITIAGVTFSITIVALSLAANQYTPRVLRNFMRDRGNQAALGGLIGIFVYCVLILRTVRGGDHRGLAAVSLLAAVALAVLGIGLFIYFIYHVAMSIQVSTIVCYATEETRRAVLKLLPEQFTPGEREQEPNPPEARLLTKVQWLPIAAEKSGFLQSADIELLLAFACKHQTIVRMEYGIGDFVVQNNPLVSIAGSRPINRQTVDELNGFFAVGPYRNIEQDPTFGIQQIVDIAVKALSPGINDPTTAVTCLGYLSSILRLVVTRRIPPRCHYHQNKLRLVTCTQTFETLLQLAFDEVRENSRSQSIVLLSLLRAIGEIAKAEPLVPERKALLHTQVMLVLEAAESGLKSRPGLERIRMFAAELAGGAPDELL